MACMSGGEIPWGLEHDEQGAASSLSYLPLYLSGYGGDHFAVVDEEDYLWGSQWQWAVKPSKNGKKFYAYRTSKYEGRKLSIFLHKEICLRAHGMPPSPSHIIADHTGGNSLDCRRHMLRWATPSENRQNYNGIYAMQLRMDYKGGKGPKRLLRSHVFGGFRGRSTRNAIDEGVRELRLRELRGSAEVSAAADPDVAGHAEGLGVVLPEVPF